MVTYGVYQFESKETCVLPTNWVIGGQVKYDSKKASEYSKKGKMPYKKWPTYKVVPISTRVFDSYDAAYKAESVLLEKSDLESTDIEAINNPTHILHKKRIRKPIKRDSTSTDAAESYSNLSSEEDEVVNKFPSVPFESNYNNDFTEENNLQIGQEPILQPVSQPHSSASFTIATESQVNELKQLILEQKNVIFQQNVKIDNLSVAVMQLTKQLSKMKQEDSFKTNDVTITTRWTFPLDTLEKIQQLDECLKENENNSQQEFKSFLLQLGGTTLKAAIKCMVKELYTLEVQQLLNYSGREGKFSTKNLMQTNLIIEVMQRNTNKTRVEAVNEYMYHMQHVTDRVRSLKKKN
ncbi:hypothetical protein FQR65_LT00173 [Abscondita terminalis]|nr:hypothetical protein FQR65_LT04899 [Abscondita terminalis]KAF5284173.1 hypothetical protein FQR65_LT00173 [Abscondita terminalis]